jgi:hypothetical protein
MLFMAYLHGQWFWQCRMWQPHPTPHKNRIIPIFGCGCRIRHCQNHCSCKQTFNHLTIQPSFRTLVEATLRRKRFDFVSGFLNNIVVRINLVYHLPPQSFSNCILFRGATALVWVF